jgi:hypothetical protein
MYVAVEVLRVYMVVPAVYVRVWQVVSEEIAQPVDVVDCHSCCFTMSIQARDCRNASTRLSVQQ